jgi:histidine triad (HIT) family protein
MSCVFCDIANRSIAAHIVFEDEVSIGFLDTRPLFPGHVLLIPRTHYETFADLPPELIAPLFAKAQRIAAIMPEALHAEGTFVAINNIVSQSVPHLHIHVVPRRKGDGLKGFFWPRTKYQNSEEAESVAAQLRSALHEEPGA